MLSYLSLLLLTASLCFQEHPDKDHLPPCGTKQALHATEVTVRRNLLSHDFSFDPYPDDNQRVINSILQTLSEGAGKLRAFTSYRVEMTTVTSIVRCDAHGVRLVVSPETISVGGDTDYKDFSLAHLLVPDRVDLRLRLYLPDDVLLYSGDFAGTDIPCVDTPMITVEIGYDGDPDSVFVALDDFSFYYDDRMHDRMRNWGRALERYYVVPGALDEVVRLTESLDPYNPATLLMDEFSLCKAESLLGAFQFEPFHGWLDLAANDPERLMERYAGLKTTTDSLRSAFNHSIVHIDSLFYLSGSSSLEEGELNRAMEYFSSAIHYNPYHILSHLAIAGIDKQTGNKVAALQRLADVYTAMFPSEKMQSRIDLLTDSVLSLFFQDASGYILEERYTQALEQLRHVEVFCVEAATTDLCQPRLFIHLSESHTGIHDSFLVVAARALRNDNLRLAETYITSALAYQKEKQPYIADASQALSLYFRVFTRYRVLADLFGLLDEPLLSNEYLASAKEIAGNHPALFAYVMAGSTKETLRSAVLNYARSGMPAESLEIMNKLRIQGTASAELSFHQRVAGAEAARHYKSIHGKTTDPDTIVRKITNNDPWFADFIRSFLSHW